MLVTLLLFEFFCKKLQHVFRNLFYLQPDLKKVLSQKRVFTALLKVEIVVFSVCCLGREAVWKPGFKY